MWHSWEGAGLGAPVFSKSLLVAGKLQLICHEDRVVLGSPEHGPLCLRTQSGRSWGQAQRARAWGVREGKFQKVQ